MAEIVALGAETRHCPVGALVLHPVFGMARVTWAYGLRRFVLYTVFEERRFRAPIAIERVAEVDLRDLRALDPRRDLGARPRGELVAYRDPAPAGRHPPSPCSRG